MHPVSKHTWPGNHLQSSTLQALRSVEPTLENIGQSVTFQNFLQHFPQVPGGSGNQA